MAVSTSLEEAQWRQCFALAYREDHLPVDGKYYGRPSATGDLNAGGESWRHISKAVVGIVLSA